MINLCLSLNNMHMSGIILMEEPSTWNVVLTWTEGMFVLIDLQ